jgi:hypothetical protein
MDFELGIVCGRCDWYSAMGTPACKSCGFALMLEPVLQTPEPPRARAPSDEQQRPSARAGLTDPPTSLFGNDQLKPRRPPSGTGVAAPPISRPISAVRAQGGD